MTTGKSVFVGTFLATTLTSLAEASLTSRCSIEDRNTEMSCLAPMNVGIASITAASVAKAWVELAVAACADCSRTTMSDWAYGIIRAPR